MEKKDLLMDDFKNESLDINEAGKKVVGAGCIPTSSGGDLAWTATTGKRDPEYDYEK